jgi:hypothetical protein
VIVARLEEAEEVTKNERKNQDENVGVNLSCVKVWYGHARNQKNIRPCCLEPSFVPILEREVGDEAGDQGARNGSGGSSGGNGVRLFFLFACLVALLPCIAKAAVLGRMNPPGHVVLAPVVGLAFGDLVLGFTILGGRLLPCLFLLLVLLVERALLILRLCIARLLVLLSN